MKSSSFIYLFFLFIVLLSCNKTKQDKVFDKIYSEHLVYPKNLKNENDSVDNLKKFFASDAKIVTGVNLGCSKCCGDLMLLEKFVDSLNLQNKVSIIVYGYAHNTNISIYDFLLFDEKFPYPIYADSTKSFLKMNKLPEYNLAYHTLLVDRNDSVRVIGSPVDNKKIADLYKQEIKKIFEEDK